MGLATGALHRAREALGELGRCLTVMRGVLETLCIGGSWAREPRRRSPGRGMQPRWLGARWRTWIGALSPLRVSTRVTGPRTGVEKALKGKNPRRAPTGGLSLARY